MALKKHPVASIIIRKYNSILQVEFANFRDVLIKYI